MAAGGSAILAAHKAGTAPVSQIFTRKELVGKGAYGGVYKGVHNDTGTVVALKVIDLDTPDDDISEIQREVALLSELRDAARHNITLYHGSYLHGHELWIAMDFASGGSIRTLMKTGPIEEKYAALITREVLVALAFLHRQGIIHRDVKAANVLLTQTGKILLCDFGVAAHLQTNSKRSTFTGTPLWMAPEVITDGKLYDTKADIWSLGITLFEMATGNPPHFGMEPLRACALIPTQAPPRLEGGTWSNGMREFLASCLQIDPNERPTADELSKSKWIKSASKLPMVILRELIVRYVSWIQAGGQRTSIVGFGGMGDDLVAREDTFDLAEDRWDFDVGGDDFGTGLGGMGGKVEPLGDEPTRAPPRTLDELAAQSHARPPKVQPPSRSHPLLRLFDEESNPYAQATAPTILTLPSGPSSLNTVKPTISIPSFDELDDMSSSDVSPFPASFGGASSAFGFGGASALGGGGDSFMFGGASSAFGAADDLMSPATVRGNPFAWNAPRFGAPPAPFASSAAQGPFAPPSPRFGRSDTPDSLWGASGGGSAGGTHTRNSSATPTEAHFPAAELTLPHSFAPSPAQAVTSSPSLPSLTHPAPEHSQLNRPFGAPAPAPASSSTPSSSSASASLAAASSSSSSSSSLSLPAAAAARRRADTAPSWRPGEPGAGAGAYPPLGSGIPRPTAAREGAGAGAGGYPPLGPGLPRAAAPAPAPLALPFGPATSWDDVADPGSGAGAGARAGGHTRGESATLSSCVGADAAAGAEAVGAAAEANRPFAFGVQGTSAGTGHARDLNRPFGVGGGRDRGWSNAAASEGGWVAARARAGSESGKRVPLKIATAQAPVPHSAFSLASPASAMSQSPLATQPQLQGGGAYPTSSYHARNASHTHARAPSSSSSAVPYGFLPSTLASLPSIPPPTASASSSFSAPGHGLQMQRGDSQTSPRTVPSSHFVQGPGPGPWGGGHRPRLSQSQTAPVPVGTPGGIVAPAPRHLRNVSSASSLLSAGTVAADYDPHTPLAASPLPALAELPTPTGTPAPAPGAGLGSSGSTPGLAPGQRHSAIGYPFPPVGDLAVPVATAAGGAGSAAQAPTPHALPAVRALDYGALARPGAAGAELARQMDALGMWLAVVHGGLDRVLAGEVAVGFDVAEEREGGGIEHDEREVGEVRV
ncbi:hypothetical protein JCM3770_002101 [Rhodotorula araucariae]